MYRKEICGDKHFGAFDTWSTLKCRLGKDGFFGQIVDLHVAVQRFLVSDSTSNNCSFPAIIFFQFIFHWEIVENRKLKRWDNTP